MWLQTPALGSVCFCPFPACPAQPGPSPPVPKPLNLPPTLRPAARPCSLGISSSAPELFSSSGLSLDAKVQTELVLAVILETL